MEVDTFDIDEISVQLGANQPDGQTRNFFTSKLEKESPVQDFLASPNKKFVTFSCTFAEPMAVDTSTNITFLITKSLKAFYGVKKIRLIVSK